MTKLLDGLTGSQKKRLEDELRDAHDFDPRDPLFGLSTRAFSGPGLSRRATLRLLAAAGTLTTAHLIPGLAPTRVAHAATGGTLSCGWSGVGEIRTLDPAQINQVLQFQITSNVLSGLFHIDSQLIAQPDLAAELGVSDDGLEYTIKLREGVTFHNGDPFNADDVIFTYERSKDPEKSIHSGILANVNDLQKIDDYTVKFVLAQPQASFLTKTLERASGRAMTIVSRGGLEALGDSQYGLTPVGTGPFKVVEHQLGQAVVLEKFDAYYDPERPKLDKVVIRPIDGAEPIAAAIEAGDIQLIGGNPIPAELVDRFLSNPDLIVDEKPAPGFQNLWVNPWHPAMAVPDFNKPLAELKKESGFMVRLALAKAIDRELLVQQAEFGRGTPAYGTINPAMGYYYDPAIAETSEQRFDPEEAQRLLAEAGYPGGEGLPKLSILASANVKRRCTIIANMLQKNLGIEVDLVIKEWSVSIDDFDTMAWELRQAGSGGDYDPDDGIVDWMRTDSKFNGRTRDPDKYPFGYWSDDEADELIAAQSTTADPEKRRELVRQVNQLTSDKVAGIFLFHPADVAVRHASVNLPDESRIPGLVDLDRVTLEG